MGQNLISFLQNENAASYFFTNEARMARERFKATLLINLVRIYIAVCRMKLAYIV